MPLYPLTHISIICIYIPLYHHIHVPLYPHIIPIAQYLIPPPYGIIPPMPIKYIYPSYHPYHIMYLILMLTIMLL